MYTVILGCFKQFFSLIDNYFTNSEQDYNNPKEGDYEIVHFQPQRTLRFLPFLVARTLEAFSALASTIKYQDFVLPVCARIGFIFIANTLEILLLG